MVSGTFHGHVRHDLIVLDRVQVTQPTTPPVTGGVATLLWTSRLAHGGAVSMTPILGLFPSLSELAYPLDT